MSLSSPWEEPAEIKRLFELIDRRTHVKNSYLQRLLGVSSASLSRYRHGKQGMSRQRWDALLHYVKARGISVAETPVRRHSEPSFRIRETLEPGLGRDEPVIAEYQRQFDPRADQPARAEPEPETGPSPIDSLAADQRARVIYGLTDSEIEWLRSLNLPPTTSPETLLTLVWDRRHAHLSRTGKEQQLRKTGTAPDTGAADRPEE